MDELDIRPSSTCTSSGETRRIGRFDLLEVSRAMTRCRVISRRFNRRTDRYAASFENGRAFFIELLHALKRALGWMRALPRASRSTLCTGPRRRGARGRLRMPGIVPQGGVVDDGGH